MSAPSRSMAAACSAAALMLASLGGAARAQAPAAAPTPAQTPAQAPAPAATPAPTASPAPAPSAGAATELPTVTVNPPKFAQLRRRPKKRIESTARSNVPVTTPPTEAQILAGKNDKLDDSRRAIVAATGAGSYQLDHRAIEALPQGTNASIDKVLLQAPGVTQDS